MWVSAIQQHESAISMHATPPSKASLPPPTLSHPFGLSQSPGWSSRSHTADPHWLCVLQMVACMCPCYSLHSSHPLCPEVCPLSAPLLLPCKQAHQDHVSRFRIFVLIYDICSSLLESGSRCPWLGEAAPQPECCSVCAQKAPARPGLPWSCPAV